MSKDAKLVYTSDPEEARRLREKGAMPESRDSAPASQNIRVSIDRKRRGGKTVTVATGFVLTPASLEGLAKTLKQKCGSGGTCHENEIEIQGDHSERVTAELQKLGYKVKKIG